VPKPETKNKTLRDRWHRAVVAVIAASRRDADLKQWELAERLGWSQSRLAKLEAGERKLDVADFILVARALNIDPEVLFRRIMKW
jgi:transcriptional regulator with XRE-family HTH domain